MPAVPLHTYDQGSGFPVLCLHGHPGSGRSMAVFTQHLSKRFRAIAPDLRGYGKSQVSQPFTMSDHLSDLEALLEQRNIDQFCILGWSLGGILAMELALRMPHRVTGLMLVATAAYPRGNHPPITWQDNILTGVAALTNCVLPGWQWNIDAVGKRSLFRHLIQKHTPATYRYLAEDAVYAFLNTSPQANQALNRALQNRYNRTADLHRITCPCWVVAGECDRHITAQSSQETAEHLPNSTFHRYPNTAHLLPWEVPKQLLADLDAWLVAHPDVVAANVTNPN